MKRGKASLEHSIFAAHTKRVLLTPHVGSSANTLGILRIDDPTFLSYEMPSFLVILFAAL